MIDMNIEWKEYLRIQKAIYGHRIDKIIQVVSEHTQMTDKEIRSKRRYRDVVRARRLAQFLIRENTPCTLSVIGELTGNGRPWDHASVLHNINVQKGLITLCHRNGDLVYPEAKAEIDELRCKVKTALLK